MEKVSQRIIDFNKGRLPEIVQLKYAAMAENLYRFYRGTNHIFYEDLKNNVALPFSPAAWICGDLHLENFGSYKSDNRLVYFDLNDFDEAILAPCLWEVIRMLTSIFIAFESLQIEEKKALHMARLFLKRYSSFLALGKPGYIERQTAQGIVCKFLAAAEKRRQKEILNKRTVSKNKKRQIHRHNPKHICLNKQLKKELFTHITTWLQNDGGSPYNYKVTDAVFRLAGTGSLGLRRYTFLLRSLNNEGEKFLLIDMKQAASSSLQPYAQLKQPLWNSEAERIVAVQTRMQNRPPALLSTTSFKGHSYVMQEMQPVKDSINFKLIKKNYRNMCRVIEDMAILTASSQLRSTGRQGAATTDELIGFGSDESWQQHILNYALAYTRHIKEDYELFLKDFKNGVLKSKKTSGAVKHTAKIKMQAV